MKLMKIANSVAFNAKFLCDQSGGDIVSGDGRGSVSIYGKHFEDENLTVDHTGPGRVLNFNQVECFVAIRDVMNFRIHWNGE